MISDKNLILRITSAVILIILTIFFNNIGGFYFLTLLFFSFFILNKELYSLFKIKVKSISFLLNCLFIYISFIFIYYNFYFLVLITTLFGVTLNILLSKNKYFIPTLSYFYLAIPFYILIYLNNHYEGGKLIILWTLIIVWSSDTSAYILGTLIKGKKLIPSISPNKTWSGFISSLIIASLASVIFSKFFLKTDFIYSLIIGIIISFFTTIGDLFESYLKRINNKKDTSKLIPGHGGLLDRLDGFLFAIVVMYIFIFIWG